MVTIVAKTNPLFRLRRFVMNTKAQLTFPWKKVTVYWSLPPQCAAALKEEKWRAHMNADARRFSFSFYSIPIRQQRIIHQLFFLKYLHHWLVHPKMENGMVSNIGLDWDKSIFKNFIKHWRRNRVVVLFHGTLDSKPIVVRETRRQVNSLEKSKSSCWRRGRTEPKSDLVIVRLSLPHRWRHHETTSVGR